MWERRSLTLDFRFLCLSAGGHFPSLIDFMIHKCNDIKLVKLIQINTKTKRPGSKVQTALTIACLSLSSHELCEEPKLICSPLPFSPQCPSSRLLTVLRGFHASLDTDTQTPCPGPSTPYLLLVSLFSGTWTKILRLATSGKTEVSSKSERGELPMVVWWLRPCLPAQGVWISSLDRELTPHMPPG